MEQNTIFHNNNHNHIDIKELLTQLSHREELIVNPHSKNGVILYKKYHAEFIGPGAIIGGLFDLGAIKAIGVGNLSLIYPQKTTEVISAYLIRQQWIRLIKQIADNPIAIERAQVILNQFENWFDTETVAKLPDEAFALLVGVLPQTIRKVRNLVERLEVW